MLDNLRKHLVIFFQAITIVVGLFFLSSNTVSAQALKPAEINALQKQNAGSLTPAEIQNLQNGQNTGATKGLTNPAISANLGGDAVAASAGVTFVGYFVYLWRVIIFVGGITVIIFYLQAGIDWINAAGDQAKVSKAREKITNATIGLVILVGSFLLISFIGSAIGYDLLNPTLPKI